MEIVECSKISKTKKLCSKYYKFETFQHCLRVAEYASKNICLRTDEERIIAFIIGLCHDLLEDTNATVAEICEATGYTESFIINVLGALTRNKDEVYMDYIKRIKQNDSIYPYIVKIADVKDHFRQKDTLKDSLKERYVNALAELL